MCLQAVSLAIFGVPDAHHMVSVEPGTSTQSLTSEEKQVSHEVTLKILAETHHHADHLQMELEKAIKSGALLGDLRSSDDLKVLKATTVSNKAIVSAGMSPQMYPSISESPTPEDLVPEVVVYFGESNGNAVHACEITAAAAVAGAVVCLFLGALIIYQRNRAAYEAVKQQADEQEDDEAEKPESGECRVIIVDDKSERMI